MSEHTTWKLVDWILRLAVAALIAFAGWGFREVYSLRADVLKGEVKLEQLAFQREKDRQDLDQLRDTGTKGLASHEGKDDQRFSDLKEDVLRRLGNIENKLDTLVRRP